MLTQITLLTSLLFASIYPLCFWISYDDPLRNKFHKFHLGLPNVIGGVLLVFILLMDFPWRIKIAIIIWKLTFFTISRLFWKKEYPNPAIVSIPCFIGIYTFIQMQTYFLGGGIEKILIGLLAGFIFSSALFAMNLGHWYLNVHGLPIHHLKRAVFVFWIFLLLRIIWDGVILISGEILYRGEMISLFHFMTKLDGFLIGVALFFGTLFPFIGLFFVRGTLALKNPQATTGILYVILCSLLLGDIAYKYYWIKFGIFL